MKKLLIVLLSCLLVFGLCACKSNENNGDDVAETTANTTEDTNNGDGDTTPVDPEPTVYETKTFTLSAEASGTIWLGEREYTDRIYPTCNYPGSGFESKLKCSEGKISVSFKTEDNCSFLVYLDGELQKNSEGKDFFPVKDNVIELDNVSAGEHTLRFIRATEFGSYVEICTITLAGELLKADATPAERTFIEFIGDGVDSKVGAQVTTSKVGDSYPYLVAEKMNADYSITSYPYLGLVSTENTVDYMYGEAFSGNFERNADIVVINVGTFDSKAVNVNVSDFKAAYRELLAKVRLVNGEECKIVLIWTSGNEEYENALLSLCREFGGEVKGYFAKVLAVSSSVPPTAVRHGEYADTLVEFINEVKNFEPDTITTEQNGSGSSIGFGSNDWADF